MTYPTGPKNALNLKSRLNFWSGMLAAFIYSNQIFLSYLPPVLMRSSSKKQYLWVPCQMITAANHRWFLSQRGGTQNQERNTIHRRGKRMKGALLKPFCQACSREHWLF